MSWSKMSWNALDILDDHVWGTKADLEETYPWGQGRPQFFPRPGQTSFPEAASPSEKGGLLRVNSPALFASFFLDQTGRMRPDAALTSDR